MEIVTVSLIGICVIGLIAFLVKGRSRIQQRLPPKKPGLPIVGNLFNFVYKDYQGYVDDLSLGDIYIFDMGFTSFTRLNSHRAVHEAFVGHADVFSGRDSSAFVRELYHDSGVANTDGPKWQEHRRLMIRLLRDFGLGRSIIIDLVHDESAAMIGLLAEKEGQPIHTKEIFSSMISNVISRLIFGERCGSQDDDFHVFIEHMAELMKLRTVDLIPFIFPWILKVGFLKRQFVVFDHADSMSQYIREKVEGQARALQSIDPPPTDVSEASNICEAFLIEQAIQERANPGGHTFTDLQLIHNMMDLFFGGSDTTSTLLSWAVVLLASNPEVQQSMQREIDEKLGRQRLPTMEDRQKLPFGCAVMDEVLRYSSLAPMNAFHRTTHDVEVLGFHIPANTVIQCNLYGIHHDPKTWEKPTEFFPGHFLSPEGEYRPSKFLIPFSLGKRSCLGESLARTEFLVALVGMMQQFTVRLANPGVDLKPILKGTMGFLRYPLTHEIIFERVPA